MTLLGFFNFNKINQLKRENGTDNNHIRSILVHHLSFRTKDVHHPATNEEITMITFQDCADYCDLSQDEIEGLLEGTKTSPIHVCAMVQEFADSPKECRKMIGFLQAYLEKVEGQSDAKRSHEVHEAISHFVSTHHMI